MLLALLLAMAGGLETLAQPDLCWRWGAPLLCGTVGVVVSHLGDPGQEK